MNLYDRLSASASKNGRGFSVSRKDDVITLENSVQKISIDYRSDQNILVYELVSDAKKKDRYPHLKWCDSQDEAIKFLNEISRKGS